MPQVRQHYGSIRVRRGLRRLSEKVFSARRAARNYSEAGASHDHNVGCSVCLETVDESANCLTCAGRYAVSSCIGSVLFHGAVPRKTQAQNRVVVSDSFRGNARWNREAPPMCATSCSEAEWRWPHCHGSSLFSHHPSLHGAAAILFCTTPLFSLHSW